MVSVKPACHWAWVMPVYEVRSDMMMAAGLMASMTLMSLAITEAHPPNICEMRWIASEQPVLPITTSFK